MVAVLATHFFTDNDTYTRPHTQNLSSGIVNIFLTSVESDIFADATTVDSNDAEWKMAKNAR